MIYKVIVDISNSEVDKIFDYSAEIPVNIGDRVLVPFGRMTIEGYVVGTKENSDRETKNIIKVLDDYPVILPEMLSLADYLKTQNLRYIDCLRLFIPSKLRGGQVKVLSRNFISRSKDVEFTPKLNAKAQILLLERLKDKGEFEAELLNEFSASVIKTLVEKGVLIKSLEEKNRTPVALNIEKKNIIHTLEQQSAINTVVEGKDGVYLLHGVTGSGKTEIYLSCIERFLALGKTAIMLVPEISLTPQMLGVFRNRFNETVSVLHSGLSDGERYDEWRKLRLGISKVALGARSAVFAPLSNVGIIILDEEHDTSYISDSNPRYMTLDIAEFRAKFNNAKLVMGSATPSVDSYLKATKGEYKLITLSNRVNNKSMPEIETIDMRNELKAGNTSIFSRRLLQLLEITLQEKNQAMIFINRRGYASFVRCKACGYVAKCTDCDVSLTYHMEEERLKCHYCGKQYQALTHCPECGFSFLSEGKTGTEKVVHELKKCFPQASFMRMDNDTTSNKDSYVNILTAFSEGKADILVGTQMIAKGHDFKNVTLVGILDADQALYFQDYRSNERTFQLITQVAGRAGRENKAGLVVMQTYNPKHFVFRFATQYDYKGFFEKEANSREVTKFPPFTKIVRLLIQSVDDEKAKLEAKELYFKLKDIMDKSERKIIRTQAMKAPIKRIGTYYRYQIVIWLSLDGQDEMLPIIYNESVSKNKNVSIFVEVNPQHMI